METETQFVVIVMNPYTDAVEKVVGPFTRTEAYNARKTLRSGEHPDSDIYVVPLEKP